MTLVEGTLLESFVGAWIVDKIQDKLGSYQYGAMKGRTAKHALIDIMHHWNKAVDEGQPVPVRAVFIDFAKAFDHVDHNVLSGVKFSGSWWELSSHTSRLSSHTRLASSLTLLFGSHTLVPGSHTLYWQAPTRPGATLLGLSMC